MADIHLRSCIRSTTRYATVRSWRAGCLMAAVLCGLSVPVAAQALSADAAGRQVAATYGVETLRVRETRTEDGRRAFAVTVMTPGGDVNGAFQVTTLLVDAETGQLIPQFRHGPTGHELSDAPSNVPPTVVDGPVLRRRSARP